MKPQAVAAIGITSLLLLLFASSARGQQIIVVDDDGLQCPERDSDNIQDAVRAAALMPGTQKIRICAGDYPGERRHPA